VWVYNCARLYVGKYVGGGTNKFEREIRYSLTVIEGNTTTKRRKPVRVKGTNSEGTMSTLQTLAIYPTTDEAIISITNSRGTHRIKLLKSQLRERSRIFKQVGSLKCRCPAKMSVLTGQRLCQYLT